MKYALRILASVLACLLFLVGCATSGNTEITTEADGSDSIGETSLPTDTESESESESISETETTLVIPEDDDKTVALKEAYGPLLDTILSFPYGSQSAGISGTPKDLGKGTTYYVSSSKGSDSNNGKSEQTPFKTVTKLNSITLKPGDNVLFCRGDVFEGQHFQPRGSGLAETGKWITVDAYGEGENPRFTKPSQNLAAIFFADHSATRGYRIRNIDIDGYLQGICIQRNNTVPFEDLLIENCTISNITLNKYFDNSDTSLLPIGAPLAMGIWIWNVKNVTVKNVSFINTDCPVRSCGGYITFDGLDIFKANMQGMMLYGSEGDLGYEQVMDFDGNVTVKNSRIRYVGMKTGTWGSTGILLENLHDVTISNVEISHLVNGLTSADACAIDLEQSNINTVVDGAYLHDNQGPAFLIMEHDGSMGNSRGNAIKNVISVNNGLHGAVEIGSFIHLTCYEEEHQTVTVEDCIDIGYVGSVPLLWNSVLHRELSSAPILSVKNVTVGTLNADEGFDQAEVKADGSEGNIANGQLQLSAGNVWLSEYLGRNHVTEAYLKGTAGLAFSCLDGENGYFWSLGADGSLLAEKLTDGVRETIKKIVLPAYDVEDWVHLRILTDNGKIKTYFEGALVDVCEDTAYVGGYCGVFATGVGAAEEFRAWSFAENKSGRYVTAYLKESAGEEETVICGTAGAWYTPETNWLPANIDDWSVRPYDVAWGRVTAANATLTHAIELNSRRYSSVQITLSNGTNSGKVWFEFTRNGKTWYGKEMTAECRSDDYWAFEGAMLNIYTLDLSDVEEWGGKVTAIRLRFEGEGDRIGLKHVIFYK